MRSQYRYDPTGLTDNAIVWDPACKVIEIDTINRFLMTVFGPELCYNINADVYAGL